ncbi:hypothetical protein [Altererythrobacter aquiaggeris]|uniref:hypothetical protein n=1 Tax=Aestuarierythrobacter aquiaggeris TaxID=1898396 RepID=UPI003018D2E0
MVRTGLVSGSAYPPAQIHAGNGHAQLSCDHFINVWSGMTGADRFGPEQEQEQQKPVQRGRRRAIVRAYGLDSGTSALRGRFD